MEKLLKSPSILILNQIPNIDILKSLIKNEEIKIFSLNYNVHNFLKINKISHDIGEDFLNEDEINAIFDKTVSLYNWYDEIEDSKIPVYNKINIFSLLDTGEFHDFILNNIYEFYIIKKIIISSKSKKFIANSKIIEIINNFNIDSLELNIFTDDKSQKMIYDNISIKFDLAKIPISFSISRNYFKKSKKIFENILCTLNNLWYKPSKKKDIVLLVEFNPFQFENLFLEFSKKNMNIVVFNNRRSAVWNKKSRSILKNNNVKVLNFSKLISTLEKNKLLKIENQILFEMKTLFKNPKLQKIFTFNDDSFWPLIRNDFEKTFTNRISEYIFLIYGTKKLLTESSIKCIMSLNVMGETEKTILALKTDDIQSIMLEHAFANYLPEISRYDILSMYSLFPEKIALWGPIQKKYLVDQHQINDSRIIECGSPKHDSYFQKKIIHSNLKKTILICLRPIIDNSGHKNSNSYEKYHDILKKILKCFENDSNLTILVKLHPGNDPHNDILKQEIKKLSSKIGIHQLTPIENLIQISTFIINVSPEGYDPSTIMMESMLLKKPVVNIVLDDNLIQFDFVKQNALINLNSSDNFNYYFKKLLSDNNFYNNVVNNSQIFLNQYLTNIGNASSNLVHYISNI
tara:strand:- start:139 stop:2031 length:1893 start_codon:yes stop_codon:yes gene_type:complete